MPSQWSAQLAVGITQAMDQFGDPATYCRADTGATVSLTVMPVEPEYLTTPEGEAVVVASDRWDILLRAADLAFAGTQYEPQPGDTITVVASGRTRVYTVLLDDARRYCWTWEDHDMVRRKVKAKYTGAA